jgi:hypothetical protein
MWPPWRGLGGRVSRIEQMEFVWTTGDIEASKPINGKLLVIDQQRML